LASVSTDFDSCIVLSTINELIFWYICNPLLLDVLESMRAKRRPGGMKQAHCLLNWVLLGFEVKQATLSKYFSEKGAVTNTKIPSNIVDKQEEGHHDIIIIASSSQQNKIVVTVGWGWSGLPYLCRKRAKRAGKEGRKVSRKGATDGRFFCGWK
jgi:hypothetical protein